LVEAQVECLAQGMRLCSRGELSLGKSGSRSAGCTFTQHQRYAPVWTRSPCTSLASRGALEEPMSEEERSNTTTLTLTELSHAKKTCPNAPFATCGGVHFTGERCCPNGSTCKTSSLEVSQCRPSSPCQGSTCPAKQTKPTANTAVAADVRWNSSAPQAFYWRPGVRCKSLKRDAAMNSPRHNLQACETHCRSQRCACFHYMTWASYFQNSKAR
jgi:hypothetical protein